MISRFTKRQRITLLVILMLLITIPLVIFLVRQQQILRGRAQVNPNLIFVNSAGVQLPGDPPTTNTRDIAVQITHSFGGGTPPPPTGITPPPPAAVTPPPPISTEGGKRVFATSQVYSGNLGGLAGADNKCQVAASGAGLGGNWKAWLSDSTQSPATRFSTDFKSSGLYQQLNGTKIADGWTDLIDHTLDAPINTHENGQFMSLPQQSIAHFYVWTNTKSDGTGDFSATIGANWNCNNWTSNTLGDRAASVGVLGNSGHLWTYFPYTDPSILSQFNPEWIIESSLTYCNSEHRLYCFEQ